MTEIKINNENEEKKITYKEQRFINLLLAIAVSLFFVAINTFFISIWLGKIYNGKTDNEIKSASAKSINEVTPYDVTDLTGTTWVINSSIIATAGYGQFDVNFSIDDITYVDIYIGYSIGGPPPPSIVPLADCIINSSWVFFANNGSWDTDNLINFTGGTDSTNINLINWLYSNATLQQSQPTQLTTPVLQSTLVVSTGVELYWSYDSSISTPYSFEIYKDNTLLTTTNSSFYTITSNGSYKVKQLGDNDLYTDSEFSNEVTISNLVHFTYNLGNNVSARTRFSLSSTYITLSDFYYLYNNYAFVISFEIDNNNANTGYVFNSVSDFDTNSSVTYNAVINNNEFMQVSCSSLTGNFTCSVSTHSAVKIAGKTYIYDNQLSTNNLSIGDYLIQNRPFVSNEKSFDNIYVNEYNYLVYDNVSTENDDVIYFLSNLTGQYISNSTYNYYLVSFDTLSAENNYIIQNYLSNDDIFFDYYRVATQTDLENISTLNDQLVYYNENYTFLSLFGSIIDAHFNTIKSLINFNLFGINLWSIFTLILTLALVYMVYKFLHGGRKE